MGMPELCPLIVLFVYLLQAGVHSGDSACTIPTQSIPTTTLNTIRDWTHKVAEALGVVGLINIQYAIQVSLSGAATLLSYCTRLRTYWLLVHSL